MLVDLMSLLMREKLLDERAATLAVRSADGSWMREGQPLAPADIRQRIREIAAQKPVSVEVTGLRTADRFPNPFWQYTLDEEVIAAWLNLRYVSDPPGERHFALEFVEPDFLADTPAFPPFLLMAQLKTVVGTTLIADCQTTEPEQERV